MGNEPTATPLISPTPSPMPTPETLDVTVLVDKLNVLIEANLWMLGIMSMMLALVIVMLFFLARGESH